MESRPEIAGTIVIVGTMFSCSPVALFPRLPRVGARNSQGGATCFKNWLEVNLFRLYDGAKGRG